MTPTDKHIREAMSSLAQGAGEPMAFDDLKYSNRASRRNERRHRLVATSVGAAAALTLIAGPLWLLRPDEDRPPATDRQPGQASAVATTEPPDSQGAARDDSGVVLYWIVRASDDGAMSLLESVASPDGDFLVPFAVEIPVEPTDELLAPRMALRSLFDSYVLPDGSIVDLARQWWPSSIQLLDLSLDGSTLIIDYGNQFGALDDPGAMRERLAQVVFTATHFAHIDDVRIEIEGVPVDEGTVYTRSDFYDLLPAAFAEVPAAGARVSGPIELRGVARTPEGQIGYELQIEGDVVETGVAPVACGTDCWGEFGSTLSAVDVDRETSATLSVFQVDENGARQHIAHRPITLLPTNAITLDP